MAWQLLAAAVPSIVSGIAGYQSAKANKPDEDLFKPQTKYLEKYLSNLRGRQSSNEIFRAQMEPALRNIGAQSRKAQQQIGYNVQRSGLAGSGIEAQQRLTASQGTQEALASATEKAAANQIVANNQMAREAMKVTSQIEGEKERAAMAYRQAMSQYDQNLKQAKISGIAGVAQSVLGGGAQMMATRSSQLSQAKGILGQDMVQQYQDAGMSAEDIFNRSNYAVQLMNATGGSIQELEEYFNTLNPSSISSNVAQGDGADSPTAPPQTYFNPMTGEPITEEEYQQYLLGQGE